MSRDSSAEDVSNNPQRTTNHDRNEELIGQSDEFDLEELIMWVSRPYTRT